MSLLPPAYRGAPYRQPRPPSRWRRALRLLIPALIAVAALALVIAGASLMRPGAP